MTFRQGAMLGALACALLLGFGYYLQYAQGLNPLKTLVAGTGECAVVDWTFLGLSIAEWSLLWFAALAGGALWLALRGRRQRRTV